MMLKKKVDGLEDYYYQWMNKYKDDADRRGELLKRLEFAGGDWSDGWCPICSGDNLNGHTADCELAKELADA